MTTGENNREFVIMICQHLANARRAGSLLRAVFPDAARPGASAPCSARSKVRAFPRRAPRANGSPTTAIS